MISFCNPSVDHPPPPPPSARSGLGKVLASYCPDAYACRAERAALHHLLLSGPCGGGSASLYRLDTPGRCAHRYNDAAAGGTPGAGLEPAADASGGLHRLGLLPSAAAPAGGWPCAALATTGRAPKRQAGGQASPRSLHGAACPASPGAPAWSAGWRRPWMGRRRRPTSPSSTRRSLTTPSKPLTASSRRPRLRARVAARLLVRTTAPWSH